MCTDQAVVDAGIDARPDAGLKAFDVVYPSEWQFSVTGQVSGYFMVIATGSAAVDMSTLHVKSIDDDHPTAFVTVTGGGSTSVPTGYAGGVLTPVSKALFVTSGLVPEYVSDEDDYLTFEIENAPAGTYDFHATVTVVVENIEIPLAMTIHILPMPDIWADPVVAKRIAVYR